MLNLGKILNKKVIFIFVIVLILIAGGFFWWWQNQADVRELNKNLPEGVRVVKSLIGNGYKVVNKIDEYEFELLTGGELFVPPLKTRYRYDK